MGIIYKATNKVNLKSYVGKTEFSLETRRAAHEVSAFEKNKNFIFSHALRKYGKDNFEWSILEECNNETLNEKEIFYIGELRTYIGFSDCQGYNMTIGGDGGNLNEFHPRKKEFYKVIALKNSGENNFLNKMSFKDREDFLDKNQRGKNNSCSRSNYYWSDERREKHSQARIGVKNGFYGKIHDEETRKKMSENGKGKITGKKNPMFGKKGENNHLTKKWIIIFPDQTEVCVLSGLNDFCDWYKIKTGIFLNSQTLSKTSRGLADDIKGFKCRAYSTIDSNIKIWSRL